MTIDANVSAKEAAEAIAWIRGRRGCMTAQLIEHVNVLERAASAYAATLPREVECDVHIEKRNGEWMIHAIIGEGIADLPNGTTATLSGTAVLPRVKE